MNISINTQLGIKYISDNELNEQNILFFLRFKSCVSIFEKLPNSLHEFIGKYNDETLRKLKNNKMYLMSYDSSTLFIKNINPIVNIINKIKTEMFIITDTVHEVSSKIKISDTFDIGILNKFPLGAYTYLMGKHKFLRFQVIDGLISGFIYDEKYVDIESGRTGIFCSMFFLDLDRNEIICEPTHKQEILKIIQLLIFVELGDINIILLAPGRNNGKSKKDGKITNTSKLNLTIVDSKWNTVSIRAEGFSVMGHLRLQAHGKNMSNRKLIWINSFEKEGYIRNSNKLKS